MLMIMMIVTPVFVSPFIINIMIIRCQLGSSSTKLERLLARRYGAKLAKRLQKAGALSKDGVLLCKKGAPVLRTWLLEMASYKKGSDNAFQWKGFWITEEEATGLCESALEQAALA